MENGVVNICNDLNRSLFVPSILCVKDTGPMISRIKPDIKVHNMGYSEGRYLSRFLFVAKYFMKEKPDVVHTHGWGACSFDGIMGAKLAGVPVVVNGEHGATFNRPYQIFIQRMLSYLCDATLSVSESLKKRIVTEIGMDPGKVTVIDNGVNTNLFNGEADTGPLKKELREKNRISFSDTTMFISSIGSLKPLKNQIFLLKAVKRLYEKYADAEVDVVFVGEGPDREMLERYSAEAGIKEYVAFLGRRDDIPAILSFADALVLTSIPDKEGMSNVILEAMSSGVPVISTPSIGTSELIADGKNGYIVDYNDTDDLCDRIYAMFKDKSARNEMSREARSLIKRKYSLDKMVWTYEKMYLRFFEK
ncbi:MAG: hypothetical protein A2204_00870 [Elusimicrobia bacterium RIFOXYA1_FULL_47_7]|nr:MAG: hypothetical protein A2204_00870 [Elusimicrobia bacterium RIFOXYA1_FULL_47_7]OGS11356.1 MAG: hypothetical protein A2386_07765 [Elusimicrobia bacterium RIFOXYB1_FULL_48_9]OGS15395.1 MAG: hypothetical protein A2251_07495 [Elusimicrobia bacterium RIFOXYA2_FULL_47_53]OGS30823.1 MAG: hypothetical protein A2323_00635 [Elusimicrobia bacterium RIFOXYB2_FULL_46_23]